MPYPSYALPSVEGKNEAQRWAEGPSPDPTELQRQSSDPGSGFRALSRTLALLLSLSHCEPQLAALHLGRELRKA